MYTRWIASALFLSTILCGLGLRAAEPPPPAAETAQQRDARMKWWREARFGTFVHWGLYSVPSKGDSPVFAAKGVLSDRDLIRAAKIGTVPCERLAILQAPSPRRRS